jgi:predicted nucleic acid-binding protein
MEVLDACVGLKWVLSEPDSDKARTIRDELRSDVRDLIAPDVFAVECAHALTKSQRRGLLSGAGKLYIDIMMDSPRLFSSVSLMDRAIEIASKARIAVYDCLYVALAEQQGCELITSDKRLLNALQKGFPFITDLATLQ